MQNNDLLSKIQNQIIENVVGKTIFVGLSGGVDSAVTAAILKNSGANVVGVFMKNWAGEQGLQLDCPWKEDMESAQQVAHYLDIPFRSYNFEKEYKKEVLDYFFDEYKKGRVPNPDILCNSEIKFKAFLKKSIEEGSDYIATGHYASKIKLERGTYSFKPAKDKKKDQTYFLADLNQSQIEKSIFPLGNLQKSEVRGIAKELNLPNAERKDSQGICFIGDLDVQEFLRKYIKQEEGNIIDIDTGKVVGKHDGISYYTVGQRKGIGIGGVNKPYYVVSKDAVTNNLFVGQGRGHSGLNLTEIYGEYASSITKHVITDVRFVKIRYNQDFLPVRMTKFNDDLFKLTAINNNIFWAPSPGQSAVIYDENHICLGRLIIEDVRS